MRVSSENAHILPHVGHTIPEQALKYDKDGGICMNQTIHCTVSSCRHHGGQNNCQLDAIDVRPNCNCHSGKCDESMCGSYDKK